MVLPNKKRRNNLPSVLDNFLQDCSELGRAGGT